MCFKNWQFLWACEQLAQGLFLFPAPDALPELLWNTKSPKKAGTRLVRPCTLQACDYWTYGMNCLGDGFPRTAELRGLLGLEERRLFLFLCLTLPSKQPWPFRGGKRCCVAGNCYTEGGGKFQLSFPWDIHKSCRALGGGGWSSLGSTYEMQTGSREQCYGWIITGPVTKGRSIMPSDAQW